MSKIIKVVFYIIIIALLYLWISSVFDSCGTKATAAAESATQSLDDVLDSASDEISDLTSEFDSDEFESEEGETSYEDIAETVEDYTEDLTAPVKSEPVKAAPKKTTPTYTPPVSGSSSGNYLIVAGSFSQETNANKLVDKLRRMGYNYAEKVRFDANRFYSVVAGRDRDYQRAVNDCAELKRKGVDCYVHTKK